MPELLVHSRRPRGDRRRRRLYRRRAVNQRRGGASRPSSEVQLTTSKRAADEDVTKFGEELQRLDTDVAGHPLDEPMQQDYQRALDAYDNAKMSLDAVSKPDEIKHVTEILEDGRYAVACVKARVADQPLPAKRPPCFFNPAHGPSSAERRVGPARWRPPRACRPARPMRSGCWPGPTPTSAPSRSALSGCRTGRADQAYAPWAQGYYSRWSGSDMLSGVLIGSLLFGGMGSMFAMPAMAADGGGGGGDAGGDVGGDAGGEGFGDGGGGDGGGGFFDGGFDFGGFGE